MAQTALASSLRKALPVCINRNLPRVSLSFTRSSSDIAATSTNNEKKQNLSPARRRRGSRLQKEEEEALFNVIQSHSSSNERQQEAADPTEQIHATPQNRYFDTAQRTTDVTGTTDDQRKQQLLMDKTQKELFQEAKFMTRSLYRTCVRSVRILKPGNEHDEAEFRRREEEQIEEMEAMMKLSGRSSGNDDTFREFGFDPRVDRENELNSRALYYLAWIKEGFNQEVDCLTTGQNDNYSESNSPWDEDNPKRFVKLMRQGEERRRWVLKDYKFSDPYGDRWDEERMVDFEECSCKYVKEVYKSKGLMLSSEVDEEREKDDDSEFWDDEDEEKE